jgi:hypothetical protein
MFKRKRVHGGHHFHPDMWICAIVLRNL